MEMSIDKTIEFFNGLECYTPQAKDARDVAIDTMRKYQVIEEIYKNYDLSFQNALRMIGKVLEDGNDD